MSHAYNEAECCNCVETRSATWRRREGRGCIVSRRSNRGLWLFRLCRFRGRCGAGFRALLLRAERLQFRVDRIRIDDGRGGLALNIVGVSACVGLRANDEYRHSFRLVLRCRESDTEAVGCRNRHRTRSFAGLSRCGLGLGSGRRRFKLNGDGRRLGLEAAERWHRWHGR